MVFDVKHFYSKTNPPYIRKNNDIPQEPPKTPKVFEGAVINGEIETFYQQKAGDCRLLSLLQSISLTDWGKEGIKKAIKSDGMGGAYVTFEGAKCAQKEFHITIEDFIKAEKNGIYSKGDDDVLAIELAAVKYLKTQGHIVSEEGLVGHDVSKLGEYQIATLLFGEDYNGKNYRTDEDRKHILKIIEEEPEKYAATFGVILEDGDNSWGHALTLKGVEVVNGKKYITFIDPNNSEDVKMMDYDLFLDEATLLRIYGINPNENNRKLMTPWERFEESIKFNDEKISFEFYQNQDDFIRGLFYRYHNFEARNDTRSNVNKFSDFQRYEIVKTDFEKIISKMDEIAWGWGFGKDKKAMIEPLLASVVKMAQMYFVNENDIEIFKKTCYKELDAIFYTNEKKIIEAFAGIIPKIEMAREEFYKF